MESKSINSKIIEYPKKPKRGEVFKKSLNIICNLKQINFKEALKGKVCKSMIYFNFKDLEKECAKAKVFIRSLKSLIEDVCDINYLSKDNTRLLVEAEQFLNEVEK